MKTNRFNRKRQGGYTLIELGIVLLIIALIAAGILAKSYFQKSTANGQTEQSTITAVIGALPNAKGTMGTAGTYGTAGTNLVSYLVTGKVIPTTYSTTATTITNAWGGAITAVSTGAGWTVTDNSLPNDICLSLATTINNSAGGTTALATTINGAALSNASTQCSTNANAVAFTSPN